MCATVIAVSTFNRFATTPMMTDQPIICPTTFCTGVGRPAMALTISPRGESSSGSTVASCDADSPSVRNTAAAVCCPCADADHAAIRDVSCSSVVSRLPPASPIARVCPVMVTIVRMTFPPIVPRRPSTSPIPAMVACSAPDSVLAFSHAAATRMPCTAQPAMRCTSGNPATVSRSTDSSTGRTAPCSVSMTPVVPANTWSTWPRNHGVLAVRAASRPMPFRAPATPTMPSRAVGSRDAPSRRRSPSRPAKSLFWTACWRPMTSLRIPAA